MAIPTVLDLLESPYIRNFFILLPFLFLGGLILFLLNRADTLRAGAGLPTAPQPPPVLVDDPTEQDYVENEDDEEADINEFLAEAGGELDLDGGADEDGNDIQPGPAGGAQGNAARKPRNRGVVGKKKARNLENRDRRRAYNEFIQSQALERKEREKALEEEMKEKTFEEKQRRALAEIKIEKQKLKEKAERKEAEEKQAKYVQALRSAIESLSGCGKISLRSLGHKVGKDEAWVRKTIQDERLLPQGGHDSVSLVTESGWLVRVGKNEIVAIANRLERVGKMDWGILSDELESSLPRL